MPTDFTARTGCDHCHGCRRLCFLPPSFFFADFLNAFSLFLLRPRPSFPSPIKSIWSWFQPCLLFSFFSTTFFSLSNLEDFYHQDTKCEPDPRHINFAQDVFYLGNGRMLRTAVPTVIQQMIQPIILKIRHPPLLRTTKGPSPLQVLSLLPLRG